jgi:hypothetical protein
LLINLFENFKCLLSILVQSATGIKGVVAIPESSKLLALVADDEDEDEYYDPNSIQYPL